MNTRKHFHVTIALLSAALLCCCALPSRSQAQQLPFHTLSLRDGLVSNYIMCFAQDHAGRLWIGTPEGLSVFDGIAFRNYSDEHGLPPTTVTAMREHPRQPGAMYIGTASGLALMQHGQLRMLRLPDDPDPWVTAFAAGRDSTLYVATARGLYRLRGEQAQRVILPESMGGIAAITITDDGTIWMVDWHGVHTFNPSTKAFRTVDSEAGGYPSANFIMHDRRGDVYVCGRDSSILHFGHGILKKKIPVPGEQPMFIIQDNHGMYWIGTSNALYACDGPVPDPRRGVRYTTENGLPAVALNVAHFDKEHNLWLGTEGKGIARLEDWHVTYFENINITGLGVFDRRGHLWLSAVDGIWEYWMERGTQWKRVLHETEPDWPSGYPYAVSIDDRGRLIVSFAAGSFVAFDITTRRSGDIRLPPPEILAPRGRIPKPDSFTGRPDRKGRLWCNFRGGRVGVFDVHRPDKLLREFTGLPVDIRTMYEDRNGRLWIAGYGSGVWYIDGAGDLARAVPRRIPALDSLSVRAFHMDRRGRMWVGTLRKGVAIIDGQRIHRYDQSHGLPSDKIFSFTETLDGTVWIGTQRGMAYARNGDAPFGLEQELADSPVYSCGVRDDGMMFIATRYTLTLYHASRSTRESAPPEVLITRMQANGRDVNLRERIELSARENNCRIEFTAIQLRRPRSIRYQYRIEGVDSAWSAPSRERSLTLAALRPGAYSVLIRAINDENIANTTPTRLTFQIARPFWQQWWFFALMLTVIGLVLYAVVRSRVRRLLEIERIRSRIAADLHDDIGSGLTRIALMTEVMQRQMLVLKRVPGVDEAIPREVIGTMERVGRISRELVEGMSDVVWSIDPRNDSMARLIDRIRVYALDVCESRDIAFHLEVSDAFRHMHTSSDRSRCLLLVCKEAINNAVRHSRARTISLHLSIDTELLRVRISDDGVGFDEAGLSRINGLTNMRNRVEKAAGTLALDSAPGNGTRITVELPRTLRN
ncbi:MAG TPA: two-component regulator propeller domain-containing protein [Bacteroidota bacterium]|nr:two-component regulator propeller domain-containing protein [Bacteroidota bacterium]